MVWHHGTVEDMTATRTTFTFISFGYLHTNDQAPRADLMIDTRRFMADPAAARDAGILDLDGRDARVQQIVARTPGARAALHAIDQFTADVPPGREYVIAVGCAGGRHRSVAVVILSSGRLMLCDRDHQVDVQVEHRHVHLPRVLHPAKQ